MNYLVFVGAALLAIGPPLIGWLTVSQAEGYTSEWVSGENASLQVAYPGYQDAIVWIAHHTSKPATIALIALPDTLTYWLQLHAHDFSSRLTLVVGLPDKIPDADYVVWPEHLLQRGFPHPAHWRSEVITAITGGRTTYCYILSGTSSAKQ